MDGDTVNAVDEIEAAIRKLTKLRDAATPGPWWAWHSGNGRMGSSVDAATHDPDNPEMVVEGMAADVDLIVTALGTIDAQLAILRASIPNAQLAINTGTQSTGVAVDLARAINGTP